MALRDHFITATAQICASLILSKHDPAYTDEDFKKDSRGGYVKVKGKYVETTFKTQNDKKRQKYKLVTDHHWRVSRDAAQIAASIIDITDQYTLPDEVEVKPNAISIHRNNKSE